MAAVEIKQIVVEADGNLCVVSLGQTELQILVGFISDLSGGSIKLVKLPNDIVMRPLQELMP